MFKGLIFTENQYCNPVCNVCLCKIQEPIHRIVIFRDNNKNPSVKRFHYFFPCWDMDYICNKYIGHKIIKRGFSCDEHLINHKLIQELQQCSAFWE